MAQDWDAAAYERNAGFVAELGEPLVALLARALFAEVREALAPVLLKPDGTWWVDYVRLRFHAAKPW